MAVFLYAFFLCVRVRLRSRHPSLSADDREFFFTASNALMISMTGYLVGGAFIALALNDLTWLTFAMVAALDRLSARAITQAPSITPPEPAGVDGPRTPAFRGGYRDVSGEEAGWPRR